MALPFFLPKSTSCSPQVNNLYLHTRFQIIILQRLFSNPICDLKSPSSIIAIGNRPLYDMVRHYFIEYT